MRRHLLRIAVGGLSLLGVAGTASAQSVGCTLSGLTGVPGVNNPNQWTVVFQNPIRYSDITVATMVGLNRGTERGLHGSAYLKGGFPVVLTWTEGPSTRIPEVRHINVTLDANGQGAGGEVVVEGGFEVFNGLVTITSTVCEDL